MAIDISAVVSDFGNYYIDGGQNTQRLKKKIEDLPNNLDVFRLIRTDDTLYRGASSKRTEVLQKFQVPFTPKGSFTFEPIKIRNFPHKIDLLLADIDQLYDSWLGWESWLGENEDRSAWPFVRWLAEVHIINQLMDDIIVNTFHSQDEPVTPGTPTHRLSSGNGLRKFLNDSIAAGSVVPLVLGAVPTDPVDFCNYIEEMVKLIPEANRNNPLDLIMRRDLAVRYREGHDTKYNSNYARETQLMTVKYYPNIRIIGTKMQEAATGIVGSTTVTRPASNKIIASPPGNLARLAKKSENIGRVQMQSKDFRQVQITSSFWHGVGFEFGEEVFTNNVELTDYV